jgi:hypothetical protein
LQYGEVRLRSEGPYGVHDDDRNDDHNDEGCKQSTGGGHCLCVFLCLTTKRERMPPRPQIQQKEKEQQQEQQQRGVEDTFDSLLSRENQIADVANKIASHVEEERARQKRFHELSMRDIVVGGVTEWTNIFSETLQVSGWRDFVGLFNRSAERAFYLGLTLVILAVCAGLVSLSS